MVELQDLTLAPLQLGEGSGEVVVEGRLDGVRGPSSRFDELQRLVAPLKARCSNYIEVRSWSEFTAVTMEKPTQASLMANLNYNIKAYKGNYAMVFMVLFMVSILLNPLSLIAVVISAFGWLHFLRKNEDPAWTPQIANVTPTKTQRVAMMGAATFTFLFFFLSSALMKVGFVTLVLVGAHAALHKAPLEDETLEPV